MINMGSLEYMHNVLLYSIAGLWIIELKLCSAWLQGIEVNHDSAWL